MEVFSRIESRREYLSLEVAVGARKLVEEIMLVRRGEHVVITADTSTDGRVVEATAQAVAAAGATPTIVWYETRPSSAMEPPGRSPARSRTRTSGSSSPSPTSCTARPSGRRSPTASATLT
jgi:hypothetical protein